MEGDPSGAILDNWSTRELETWFREQVASDPQFNEAISGNGIDGVDKFPRETQEGLRAIGAGLDLAANKVFGHDAATAFGRLAPQTRDSFFFAWTSTHPVLNPATDTENAEWADPAAVGALITLPDGTQISDDMDNRDYEPSRADGPPPPKDASDDPIAFAPASDPHVLPQPWWRTSKAVRWSAVGVATVILAAGAASIVGGSDTTDAQQASGQDSPDTTAAKATEGTQDTTVSSEAPAEDSQVTGQQSDASQSTSDSVEDPVGDISQAFPDFDGVDPERTVDGYPGQRAVEAADITGFSVVSDADESTTTMKVGFNGDAQGINTTESGTLMSRSLSGDVLISPPEGRILNVLFRRDGTIKISDIPSGMGITTEWVTPDELLIIITGLALNPGTQVEAIILLEAYGGIMSDVVSLITTNP